MILIIGGSYQGKREYAKQAFSLSDADFFTCTEDTTDINFSKRAIEHLEKFALGCVRRGVEPKAYFDARSDDLKDHVFISDDVSCGVVPVDETLRAWREACGRLNNALAANSDHVYRVFCGLGQMLK